MQRYFVNEWSCDQSLIIKGDDFHHITRVMRMKEGSQIYCVNSKGQSAICTIAEITDESVLANVVKWEEGSSELPVKVSIVSGLPKGDKLELIIQKGTELGAAMFIPFTAARSVIKWDEKKASKKLERWQKIAKEAAEQSHRNIVPEISQPVDIKGLLELSKSYSYKLIAYEEEARSGEGARLASALSDIESGQSILFVFGPEGGLTEQEVSLLMDNGFKACGLGPRILRTETAPLYVLSAVSYHTELLR
ncbi:16S rRNA (uracil(1498)-N(3))-methyltransferase [Cytobacillus spongiae]|uniref:16S rRNA (uracil(1498)-N(3))-methyltransferase n=1 Tax=Cytobacillus spongiae TaxID=2901381 RepID=UPI001F379111|nr:16S rRNA (uracil(1498)-N(3))-methyltransferase [Cytobacillus spongiae]UII54929.1 16S rRNA (uracil(1498)-N(3))-methyltransferase [Cytobacillus spongiae]